MQLVSRFLALSLLGSAAVLSTPSASQTVEAVIAADAALTPEAINAASLAAFDQVVVTGSIGAASQDTPASAPDVAMPSAVIARLQVLLDRAGASPGVIDGLEGSNLRNAIAGFQRMHGLAPDGRLDPEAAAALDQPGQAIGSYVISADDHAALSGPLPEDYAALAKLEHLGYTSVEEKLAERFHMDVEFLRLLNPEADFSVGQAIFVADLGADRQGEVAKVEVDKAASQVRAYGADGALIATYPATIGSDANPSPSGTHLVKAVVANPDYTYNPEINFKQAGNDEVLRLPPGPNGPVGTVWIDLSEPTYGIHGTPEPDKIDKTGSHGCVRLTNWDAEELGKMLTKGVPVTFLEQG